MSMHGDVQCHGRKLYFTQGLVKAHESKIMDITNSTADGTAGGFVMKVSLDNS